MRMQMGKASLPSVVVLSILAACLGQRPVFECPTCDKNSIVVLRHGIVCSREDVVVPTDGSINIPVRVSLRVRDIDGSGCSDGDAETLVGGLNQEISSLLQDLLDANNGYIDSHNRLVDRIIKGYTVGTRTDEPRARKRRFLGAVALGVASVSLGLSVAALGNSISNTIRVGKLESDVSKLKSSLSSLANAAEGNSDRIDVLKERGDILFALVSDLANQIRDSVVPAIARNRCVTEALGTLLPLMLPTGSVYTALQNIGVDAFTGKVPLALINPKKMLDILETAVEEPGFASLIDPSGYTMDFYREYPDLAGSMSSFFIAEFDPVGLTIGAIVAVPVLTGRPSVRITCQSTTRSCGMDLSAYGPSPGVECQTNSFSEATLSRSQYRELASYHCDKRGSISMCPPSAWTGNVSPDIPCLRLGLGGGCSTIIQAGVFDVSVVRSLGGIMVRSPPGLETVVESFDGSTRVLNSDPNWLLYSEVRRITTNGAVIYESLSMIPDIGSVSLNAIDKPEPFDLPDIATIQLNPRLVESFNETGAEEARLRAQVVQNIADARDSLAGISRKGSESAVAVLFLIVLFLIIFVLVILGRMLYVDTGLITRSRVKTGDEENPPKHGHANDRRTSVTRQEGVHHRAVRSHAKQSGSGHNPRRIATVSGRTLSRQGSIRDIGGEHIRMHSLQGGL